ncbi:MAG: hypothetical protein AAFQ19_06055 [Pseudomonadota bacterium]
MTLFSVLKRAPVAPVMRHAYVLLLACLCAALALKPASGADVPATPERAALFWYKDTGTNPGFDLIALTSGEFRSAPEINRDAIRQSIEQELNSAFAAVDVSEDVFVLRINARMSEYDPREGGFFLNLFSGNSYIPLELRDDRNARGAFNGKYELHFLNNPDFYFWQTDQDTAQGIMASAGREPRVVVEFRVQPIAGQIVPPGSGVPRRVWGRVIEASVEIGAQTPFSRQVPPVPPGELLAARAQALDIITNPDDLTMAMLWHKIVDGPEPDWAKMVRDTDAMRRADVFARDAVEAELIADARAYYNRINPAQAFRLTLNADVGPYDMANAVFPISLGGAVRYDSSFPFVAYPDDAARAAKRNAGKAFVVPGTRGVTDFRMVFENGNDLPGFEADQDLARLLGLNLRGQAEVVVRPVAVEVIENRNGTDAEKFLHTRIEQIRVIDGRSGKLLHKAAYPRFDGQIEQRFRTPEPEAFQGTDPYSVDIRGLKLGMSEAEAVAVAEDVFGDVRYMKDPPSMIRAFGDNRERVAIVLDMDRNVKAINYVRTWSDDLAQPVLDAAVTRYGQPARMRDLRIDPLTRSDKEANFSWTTNADRIGGFTGRVWFWSSQNETKLYLDLEDRRRPTYEEAAPVISLD